MGKALVSSPVLPALVTQPVHRGAGPRLCRCGADNRTTKGANARTLPKCGQTTTMQADTQVSAPGADTGLLKPCNFLGDRYICCSTGLLWVPVEGAHGAQLLQHRKEPQLPHIPDPHGIRDIVWARKTHRYQVTARCLLGSALRPFPGQMAMLCLGSVSSPGPRPPTHCRLHVHTTKGEQ